VALVLVRPGKGGGREGLPRKFSVDGICADGDKRLGRLESRTSATTKAHMVAAVCIVVVVVPGGGGGLENEIVKEKCVERVFTHARLTFVSIRVLSLRLDMDEYPA
jgi:hypothetical protein